MTLDWQILSRIKDLAGSPFFIADLDRFYKNFESFQSTFQEIYPSTEIAFPLKANYLPAFFNVVKNANGWLEVSSGMEYRFARRSQFPGNRIIFNGPAKTEDDIRQALSEGALINAETHHEVDIIRKIALENQIKCNVGLRCNLSELSGINSRFGFEPGIELISAFNKLQGIPNCTIVGLHVHINAPDKSPNTYSLLASGLLEVVSLIFKNSVPYYINMGGGFFSSMEPFLAEQFPYPIPSISDYAKAIATSFAQIYNGYHCPTLLLEPGLAIVADAMSYIVEVVDVRERGGKCLAQVLGTVYDINQIRSQRQLPMTVAKKNSENLGVEGVWDVVGYTCMEHDILYKNYHGRIGIGDFLVFSNTGAYSLTLSPSFIHPRPAVVSVDNNNEIFIHKLRETEENALACYVL